MANKLMMYLDKISPWVLGLLAIGAITSLILGVLMA